MNKLATCWRYVHKMPRHFFANTSRLEGLACAILTLSIARDMIRTLQFEERKRCNLHNVLVNATPHPEERWDISTDDL